jgi:hypothetical protein
MSSTAADQRNVSTIKQPESRALRYLGSAKQAQTSELGAQAVWALGTATDCTPLRSMSETLRSMPNRKYCGCQSKVGETLRSGQRGPANNSSIGIVLQLKSMNLKNVTNFPFPTPPDRQSLAKAEKVRSEDLSQQTSTNGMISNAASELYRST